MTPAEVITQVRRLIQDETAATYRYSDTMLLGFVNQTIKRMIPYRPDLFVVEENVSLTAGTVTQALPTGAVRLIEVLAVTSGDAMQEVNRETLDQMYPGWRTETAATPQNWMRDPRNPTGFMVWPRPTSGITVVAQYVKTPSDYASGDTIALPSAYFPVIVDGVVFLAESIDAEHVNNGRAKFFYDSFIGALGADFTQRTVTDSEDAAVGKSQPGQQRGRNDNG